MTVVSASGDSARPDTPCSSPYVTCVGGTRLTPTARQRAVGETAWSLSGSGDAKTFATPAWQQGVVPGPSGRWSTWRSTPRPGKGYWIRRFGNWEAYGGTSFSAPVFAGMSR
jgi:kumamolisin